MSLLETVGKGVERFGRGIERLAERTKSPLVKDLIETSHGAARDSVSTLDRIAKQRTAYKEAERFRSVSRPVERVAKPAENFQHFHGTVQRLPGDRFSPNIVRGRDWEQMVGPGVYLTDSLDIAGEYSGKGALELIQQGKAAQIAPTVYGVDLKGPVKALDLEQPLPSKVFDLFQSEIDRAKTLPGVTEDRVQQLTKEWERPSKTVRAPSGEHVKEVGPHPSQLPGREVYQRFHHAVEETFGFEMGAAKMAGAKGESLSMIKPEEIIDRIQLGIRGQGYDALSHKGGQVISGAQEHNVLVLLNPEKSIAKTVPFDFESEVPIAIAGGPQSTGARVARNLSESADVRYARTLAQEPNSSREVIQSQARDQRARRRRYTKRVHPVMRSNPSSGRMGGVPLQRGRGGVLSG